MAMDIDVKVGDKRQMLSTTLYGRYLHSVLPDVLRVAWEAVRNVHAVEFENDGIRNLMRRAMCGISEKTATLALWVSSVEKLYLAVPESHFS